MNLGIKELNIRSETRLSFEIDYGDETFILRANGGTWELVDINATTWRNLGSFRRVTWIGALRKALEAIGAYDNERDGIAA